MNGKYLKVSSPKCGIYLGLDAQHYAFSCLNFTCQSTPVMSRKIFHVKSF